MLVLRNSRVKSPAALRITKNPTVHAFFAFAALSLTACNEPPILVPDFCEEQQRTISAKERKVSALVYVATDGGYNIKLSHFISFSRELSLRDPALTQAEIADQYLKRFPKCCSVQKPRAVENYPMFGNTESHDWWLDEARDFGVTHEVVITNLDHEPKVFIDNDEPSRIHSSKCGKSDFVTVG